MVDEAGDKARARLEGWIAAARETLADVERMLGDISTRAEALPAEAERRAEALRASMEQNLGALLASAQKASEETKALDAAFQQRVRQNYEMLSEAVRLMGLVAGAEPPTAKMGDAPAAEPRIRLRPVATDEEFTQAVTEATGGAEPQEEGLGWKGLLESLDRDGADPEHLSERMVAELKELGVDAEAMLPKVKVDGIAAAVQAGDIEGARQVVRSLGGQTIEKVSRRLFADAAVRGQAERYRRRFAAMLIDARDRDHEGFLVGSLLASEEGRAWLILDAAAGNRA
jgi:DNA repair exonuclease SbcCD ATPase subunit